MDDLCPGLRAANNLSNLSNSASATCFKLHDTSRLDYKDTKSMMVSEKLD